MILFVDSSNKMTGPSSCHSAASLQALGDADGKPIGGEEGAELGRLVGGSVGRPVGFGVGDSVGRPVGFGVGAFEGDEEGTRVG